MSSTETRLLTPGEYPEWDRLVNEASHGTYFHRSEWVTGTARVQGRYPRIYGYFDHGSLRGGCSLYESTGRASVRMASSVNPMSPYGGIVVHGDSGKKPPHGREQLQMSFYRSLSDALSAEALDHVDLMHSPGLNDIRYYIWNGWENRVLYTYHLPLDGVTLTRNARRSCATAAQHGVTIERSDDLNSFCRLLEGMYARKGVDPNARIDRPGLSWLHDHLKTHGSGELWFARETDGTLLAADLLVIDGKRAYRYLAASDPDRPLHGAAYLLLSTILESLKERGVPEMNMMTANVPRLAEFSAKFNPTVVAYYSCEWRSKRLLRLMAVRDMVWRRPTG